MSKINELFNIKIKVIIITGGTGLLRTEYAKILASNGAHIIIIDVDEKKM